MRAEWIGEATAVTSRWVSTWTSFTPDAFRAVTAPRPVAPKLMTAARSGRPYSPVIPMSCMACSTEQ